MADVEPLARKISRLEELRLAAVEGRLEADLAAGLHSEVTGELERLVREYPLRERLWRLLMLALYRGGRQADALAAYQRARAMLVEQLGLEPGWSCGSWSGRCCGRRSRRWRNTWRGIICRRC